jgi:putative sensor protein
MSAGTAARRASPAGERLTLRKNPLHLAFSASPWLSLRFIVSYLIVSCVTFSVALTAACCAATLAVTVLAIPLLLAGAQVVHWCAAVERRTVAQFYTGPVGTSYLAPDGRGIWARAKAAWRDRAIWREIGYLIGLWAPLYALDTVVLSVWLTFLAGITVPLWYWAPRGTAMVGYVGGTTKIHGLAIGYFPHGGTGPGSVGIYVDTLPKALLVAVAFAVLFLLFNYVLVATARMHARVARALLRPPADPLEEVRSVLTGPGPLGPLTSAGG